MRQQADVKCYHCGYASGSWVWPAHASPAIGAFRAAESQELSIIPLARIRCAHCRGPVYLDEIETVRESPRILVPRRGPGRPRKLAS